MKRIGFLIAAVVGAGAIAAAALGGGTSAVAGNGGPPFTRATIPPGFDQVLVFIANGEFPDDELPYIVTDFFQTEIMGRTPAEIAQQRAIAEQFFMDRFGIPNAQTNPDVIFESIFVDPRLEYRAYMIGGGEKVPEEGWVVRDGGYQIAVVNPSGITLGGEYAGVHAPMGTTFGKGEYNIARTKLNGQPLEPLVITWESIPPGLPNPIGTFAFINCRTTNPEFGVGRAQGFVGLTPVGNGMINANLRNIITFSQNDGL